MVARKKNMEEQLSVPPSTFTEQEKNLIQMFCSITDMTADNFGRPETSYPAFYKVFLQSFMTLLTAMQPKDEQWANLARTFITKYYPDFGSHANIVHDVVMSVILKKAKQCSGLESSSRISEVVARVVVR